MSQEKPSNTLIKAMQALTTQAWETACQQHIPKNNPSREEIEEFTKDLRYLSLYVRGLSSPKEDHYIADMNKLKEKIEESYLDNLITLSTEDLSNILYLHEHGSPYRADRTIEAINSELARREIFNDSSQSDTIYKNAEQRSKTQ